MPLRTRGLLALLLGVIASNLQSQSPQNLPAAIPFPYPMEEKEGATPVIASLDSSRTEPVPKALLGFDSDIIGSGVRLHDPAHVKLLSGLDPGLLRFPGGILGNFYRWKKDDFFLPTNQKLSGEMLPQVPQALQRARQSRQAVLASYQQLQLKTGSETLCTISLIHSNPDDAVNELVYLREKGNIKVTRVELGYKAHRPGCHPSNVKSAEAYSALCRAFYRRLKQYDPTLQVGAWIPLPKSKEPHDAEWGPVLASEYKKSPFCDALVVEWESASGGKSKGIDTLTLERLLNSESSLSFVLASIQKNYGSPPVWIGNWNINPQLMEGSPTTSLKGTGAQSFSLIDQQLALLNAYQVESALFGPVVDVNRNLVTTSGLAAMGGGPYSKTVYQSAYGAMSMLATARKDSTSMQWPVFEKNTRDGWRFPVVDGVAFLNQKGWILLLMNQSPVPQRVSIRMDGKKWTGLGWRESLPFGSLGSRRLIQADKPANEEKDFDQYGTLPAFSINLVRLYEKPRTPVKTSDQPQERLIELKRIP